MQEHEKYIEIVDNTAIIKTNYLRTMFFRNDNYTGKISRLRWIWFCWLDILFGEELLENLIINSGNSRMADDPEREYGNPMPLSRHIPTGLITRNAYARHQIIQLLYYKFYLQYGILNPTVIPQEDKKKETIDVTHINFRLRKNVLYEILSFRRAYTVTAIMISIIFDAAVFFTYDLRVAFITAVSIEIVRRSLKICL